MRKQYLYYDSGFWSESFNNYIPPHPQDACSMFEYASCMGFPVRPLKYFEAIQSLYKSCIQVIHSLESASNEKLIQLI